MRPETGEKRFAAASRVGPAAGENFDTFQTELLPRKLAHQIAVLREGTFLDRRENVLAFGSPGTGKSQLLAALGQELVRAGRRVYFTSTSLIVQELLRAKANIGNSRRDRGGWTEIPPKFP